MKLPISIIVLAGLCAAFVVLNILDVVSTNAFLASKAGKEANPINAWAQRVLGGWWWIVKLPLVLVLAVAWWYAAAVAILVAMAALDGFYLVTVVENFRIARNA